MTTFNGSRVTPPLSAKVSEDLAECQVCPHGCRLRPGQLGRCGVRQGVAGRVQPLSKGFAVVMDVGCVEDHPLFHFWPGMRTLCVGSLGCSARCRYCENWDLAFAPHEGATEWCVDHKVTPTAVVEAAQRRGCGAISFTYNEPTIWMESVIETAQLASTGGLRVVLITNGFVSEPAWHALLPCLDGVKVDLKAPVEASYQRLAGISLRPVLESVELLRATHIWHELSTVIIPGQNATQAAIARLAAQILKHSGPETPWHLLRFFPSFQMAEEAPTELQALRDARAWALKEGLHYVYISNIPGIAERGTQCPNCGTQIARRGMESSPPMRSQCPVCRASIAGRGLASPMTEEERVDATAV